jgi:hypothetical protein
MDVCGLGEENGDAHADVLQILFLSNTAWRCSEAQGIAASPVYKSKLL